MKNVNYRATGLIFGLAMLAAAAVVAGPLDPPAGPISSTFKTLTEVEPRTCINSANTPGDADSVFRITQAGSYYLTANVQGEAARHGIEIAASNVSIDLGGFTVQGVPGSLAGVRSDGSHGNLSVRNGKVVSWGDDGVSLNDANGVGIGCLVEQVQASQNGSRGIATLENGAVRFCVAESNTNDGISAARGVLVESCSARLNRTGFSLGAGAIARGCSSRRNTTNGFEASNGASIIDSCVAQLNGANGIVVVGGCAVSDCIVMESTLDGIVVTQGGSCNIQRNLCSFNGNGGDGAGIHIFNFSTRCRIEGNTCTGSDRGIDVDTAGCIITGNACSGNTVNWDVVAGNACLVEQAAVGGTILGNTGGVSIGSGNPSVNYTY